MPKKDHPTFGDIQRHTFLTGTILAVYIEDEVTPEAQWDTADVQYEGEKIFHNAPVRYHCQRVGVERENGAVADGGRGFSAGDSVVLMARVTTESGKGAEYDQMFVIAHTDGVRACMWDYVLIRMSASAFIPHEPPYGSWEDGVYTPFEAGSHEHEYATIWDAGRRCPASILNPTTGETYAWPVKMEALKPLLDNYVFEDADLFELQSQGDAESEEAGFTPQWREDVQGNKIRGDAEAQEWWTSYNINGNPISNLFYEMEQGIYADDGGAGDGTFQRTVDLYEGAEEQIAKWIENSPLACNRDVRENDVKGSDETVEVPQYIVDRVNSLTAIIKQMESLMQAIEGQPGMLPTYLEYKATRDAAQAERDELTAQSAFVPWAVAHDIYGEPLQRTSTHWQLAYGEDEIWVCGKQIYQGMVISPCDAAWKFVRHSTLPPVIAISDAIPATRLANGTNVMGGVTYGENMSFEDISFALASDVSIVGDNNIFSYGTLKRLLEGCYHRTENPAMKNAGVGSWRLKQLPRPNRPKDPVSFTALNTRYSSIDVWDRYDNWMNTFNYSCASPGTDRTWWFKSYGMQWRISAYYIDTPLGSMFYNAPTVEVALWNMSGLNFSTGNITARRDIPWTAAFNMAARQSERVMCQLYISRRQGVSLWEDPELTFAKQTYLKGPFDSMDPAEIKWVNVLDEGGNPVSRDYYEMEPEERIVLLDDRTYIRAEYEGEEGYEPGSALNNNRNEVEIMAACDTVSSLQAAHGRAHPVDMERDGRFEKSIAELIEFYYTSEGADAKDLSDFNIEARIV